MKDIYEKVGTVIAQILMYSKKVSAIRKPVFRDEDVLLIFLDQQGIAHDISITYSTLTRVHDHSLETMVFDIMVKEDIL